MAKNPLNEAEQLWKKHKWKSLISLLDPMSSIYRDNARFHTLLGTAFLYKDDIGGAYSCLRRAQNLDYRDTASALGLASVFIRRGETDKALQLYVDILERQPRNRIAKKGLAYLRRYGSDTDNHKIRKLKKIYPKAPPRISFVLAVSIIAVFLILAFLFGQKILIAVKKPRHERIGISGIVLSPEEAAAPIGIAENFELVLTEKEAVETFEKAKTLFSAYRDEAALVELNRLRLSNASRQIKAKADTLALYVREPAFTSMPDKYLFKEVSSYPKLYEGVAVIWRGLPANINSVQDKTVSFDLLVGYQDKKRLDGIVNVRLGFDMKLESDRAIEILARVRNSGDGFFLECSAVHEL